ncbi:NAD kinase [Microbacterium pseudoresistens]|uniref:NAD kinase n=1 Tax=Microbacterium pseudoresistens TaxID=640634 RepID=A0A7Y9EXG0_9MICO|nr:NAD kinase [Microbacterium pseudoresistens]NYD55739.1 NAD+ kinase [Microbacterium pseudoresistens]
MNERNILVVAHAHRDDTVQAARRVIEALRAAGARAVLSADDRAELAAVDPAFANVDVLGATGADGALTAHDLELAIVLGGDGTILRAAELVRGTQAPVLGINMGHVGFLAEIERDDMDAAVARVIGRDYLVEERLALSVRVKDSAGAVVYETWALNEATVEKASRERMIEVVVEIDGRPLSSFGCDGMVVSTPTGSTAYNFSAGGPVIWPGVAAIAVVPLSAHALFARPLVVSPDAPVAIELLERTDGTGILWCDGRRSHELPPGARVIVRQSSQPVRLARLHPSAFTDRLVRKFGLPVEGWRGGGR